MQYVQLTLQDRKAIRDERVRVLEVEHYRQYLLHLELVNELGEDRGEKTQHEVQMEEIARRIGYIKGLEPEQAVAAE